MNKSTTQVMREIEADAQAKWKLDAFATIREFVNINAPASQDGLDWREVEFSGFKFQIFGIGRRAVYVRLEYLDVPIANENPIYTAFDVDAVECALTIIANLSHIKAITSRLPLAADDDGEVFIPATAEELAAAVARVNDTTITLTDEEADNLHKAFADLQGAKIMAVILPKSERKNWAGIAFTASFKPLNILKEAQARSTF